MSEIIESVELLEENVDYNQSVSGKEELEKAGSQGLGSLDNEEGSRLLQFIDSWAKEEDLIHAITNFEHKASWVSEIAHEHSDALTESEMDFVERIEDERKRIVEHYSHPEREGFVPDVNKMWQEIEQAENYVNMLVDVDLTTDNEEGLLPDRVDQLENTYSRIVETVGNGVPDIPEPVDPEVHVDIDYEQLAGEIVEEIGIDYEKLGERIEVENLAAYVVEEIDFSEEGLAENLDVDTAKLAKYINVSEREIASYIDEGAIAAHLDEEKIGDSIDVEAKCPYDDGNGGENGYDKPADTFEWLGGMMWGDYSLEDFTWGIRGEQRGP